jgi:hypothetical protein
MSTGAASVMFWAIDRLPAHVITTDRTSPAISAVRITTIAVRVGLGESFSYGRGAGLCGSALEARRCRK